MDPPRLLAKGRDLLAAQIREEAQWAGVPIVENPPLARSLYLITLTRRNLRLLRGPAATRCFSGEAGRAAAL
jgi:type III secretory pathway component EscU